MPDEQRSLATVTPSLAYPDIPVKRGTVASRIQAYNLVRDDPVVLARRRSRALERLTTTLKQRREALAERRAPYRSSSATSKNDGGRNSRDRPGSSPALAEHVRSGFGRRTTQRFAIPAERTSSYGFPKQLGSNSDQTYGTPAATTSASDASQLRGYFSTRVASAAKGSQHRIGLDAAQSSHSVLDRALSTPSYRPSFGAINDETSLGMTGSNDPLGFTETQPRPSSDIEAVLGRQLDVEELKGLIKEVERQQTNSSALQAAGDNNDLQLKEDLELLRGSIAEILERPTDELQGTEQEASHTRTRTGSVQHRFADTPLQQPSPLIGQGRFHPDKLLSTSSSPDLVPSSTAIALPEEHLQRAEPDTSDLDSLASSTLSTTRLDGSRKRRWKAGLDITGSNTSESRLPRSSLDTERCYGGPQREISLSPSPERGPPERGRQNQVYQSKAGRRRVTVSPPSRSKRRRRLPSSVTPSVCIRPARSRSESDLVPTPPEASKADGRRDTTPEDVSADHPRRRRSDYDELGHKSLPNTAAMSPDTNISHGLTTDQQVGTAVMKFRQPSIQSFASSQLSGEKAVGKPSWWKFGVANKRRHSEIVGRAQLTDRPRLTLAETEKDSLNARSPEVVAVSAISAKGTMTPSNADISRPQSLKSYNSTMTLPRPQATVQATQSSLKHPLGQETSESEAAKVAPIVGSQKGNAANNSRQALGKDYDGKHTASAPSVSVASEHGQVGQVRIRGFSVVVNFDGRDDLIITAQLPTPNPAGPNSYSPPAGEKR